MSPSPPPSRVVRRSSSAPTVTAPSGWAVGGKRELARGLGTLFALNYRSPDWVAQVRDAVGEIDIAFDGVGGTVGRAAFELITPGGRMFVFGMASGAISEIGEGEAARRGVTADRGAGDTGAVARTHRRCP